jgi:hypothetical protein
MTVEELMAESMVLERATTMLTAMMQDMARRRNQNEIDAAAGENAPDKAYDVVIDLLRDGRRKLRIKSNELWKEAERKSELHEPAVEALANAVIQKAAEDYECALCGKGFAAEKIRIEKFAEEGAEAYTKLDLDSVLARIRAAHPEFVKTARKNVEDIVADTKRIRDAHDDVRSKAKHRCPLCGGGLFAYGKNKNKNIVVIRCTGCEFVEAIPYENHD